LERADAKQRDVLQRVGRDVLDAAGIAQVQQAIVECGALAEMELRIEKLTSQAIAAITAAPIEEMVRERLVELARFVSDRKT